MSIPPEVRVEGFETVADEWEQLLPLCATNTVFVTPWWQRTWWRHFGAGSELRILSIRENGAVLGIAPLMLRDGVVGFIAGADLCDYADILVSNGNEELFYETLLGYIRANDWHTIDLNSIPHGSPTLRYLPALAGREGYVAEVEEVAMAPAVSLPSSWEEYLAGLTKKDRHEVRRKIRRIEGAGAHRQYTCGTTANDIRECMQEFFRLLRDSRADKAEFMTPERESFFSDAALELGARGRLRLEFLELAGARVATCIGFDYGDSYMLYNSGYDPRYSDLSVGLVNTALAIKGAIRAGKRCFDFLTGTERYKYHLGGVDNPVYRLVLHSSHRA